VSTLSSAVPARSAITMRFSTRSLRLMYSSRLMSGQKFTIWIWALVDPMRSMRPKRWMIRTGFQWMS
jgi:hypothetical protein